MLLQEWPEMDKRSVDYFDFAKGAVRRILDLRSYMSALSPDRRTALYNQIEGTGETSC